MNIFVLDKDRKLAAQYHHDKHVVKMVLESTQLLSNAMHSIGQIGPYKQTHINHPCSVWARESSANFLWLMGFALCLSEEYTHRYGKEHSCDSVICSMATSVNVNRFPRHRRTSFAQAMPEEYKSLSAITAYRSYYIATKIDNAKWTNRPTPPWIEWHER